MIKAVRSLLDRHPLTEWLIPVAFCVILLVQLLSSVSQMSEQADESTHLYAGYRVLKCSDYAFGREHPPLAKILAAAPLLASNPPMNCAYTQVGDQEADQATQWLYSLEGWWSLLMQARLAASLASVALCLGVWIVARRMFGRAVAIFSTALLVFEPDILAFGALVLNDVLLTALLLFTLFTFYLWTRERRFSFLILTGLLTGMALLTKHSAVLLIPILCLLAAVETFLERGTKKNLCRTAGRNLGAVAAMLLIAAATIWVGYGLHYADGVRRASNSISEERITGMNSPDMRIIKAVRSTQLMPEAYLIGLIEVRGLVTSSEGNYILGRAHFEAPWYFYPLTATVKLTLAFLALVLLGGAGIVAMLKERRHDVLLLLLPALLYLAMSTQVRAIGSFKYLLPMLPFLLIAVAAGCVHLARRYRWVASAAICMLVLHAASSLRAYPNYLSYANEAWGGSRNLYKHLPWTDVGQAYWQVSKFMEQHPGTPCWVDSDFHIPAHKYHVPCTPMGSMSASTVPERMKGIVFVSGTNLQRGGQPGGPLAPFYPLEPAARLGGSAMLVYEGEFDTRVAASRALVNQVAALLKRRHAYEAIPLAKRALELTPSSPMAHYWYGISLVANGQPQQAIEECSISRKLVLADLTDGARYRHAAVIALEMEYFARRFGLPSKKVE